MKMGKNSKFDKLNEWIKAEYDRETEEIEESLSNDGSFDPNRIDSEELFQRIQSRIREREVHETENGIQGKKRRITVQKAGKWAALFFVALTGVFFASMTSEANRSYFIYKMQYLVGNEITLYEGNEEGSNNIENKKREEKIETEIKNQLDVLVPYFDYKLQLASDDAYSIPYGNTVAILENQYNKNIMSLRIFNKNRVDISGREFEGKIIKELNLEEKALTIVILEMKSSEDKEAALAAQWEYQGGFYQLSGKADEKEFIKILESIIY